MVGHAAATIKAGKCNVVLITLGGKSLAVTLIFTMVTCMILGMGVPSIPAYIITAIAVANCSQYPVRKLSLSGSSSQSSRSSEECPVLTSVE